MGVSLGATAWIEIERGSRHGRGMNSSSDRHANPGDSGTAFLQMSWLSWGNDAFWFSKCAAWLSSRGNEPRIPNTNLAPSTTSIKAQPQRHSPARHGALRRRNRDAQLFLGAGSRCPTRTWVKRFEGQNCFNLIPGFVVWKGTQQEAESAFGACHIPFGWTSPYGYELGTQSIMIVLSKKVQAMVL